MLFEKIHLLRFSYHKMPYRVRVGELSFYGGNAIYKIALHSDRYWLIYRSGEWQFIADLPPDDIRGLLLKKIKKLSAARV